ncbi:glutamyl-tRNA synthetase, partial [Candidatus Magnetobacterium bavaricum]
RRYGGTFILRIEDTDRGRSTDEYIEAILDGMMWLGLGWDDGPYRQTDRSELYNQYVRQLLDTGMAYYCYCSADELEEKRKRALASGKPPKYDGTCRDMKDNDEIVGLLLTGQDITEREMSRKKLEQMIEFSLTMSDYIKIEMLVD